MRKIKEGFDLNSVLITIVLGLLSYFGSGEIARRQVMEKTIAVHETELTVHDLRLSNVEAVAKEHTSRLSAVPTRREMEEKLATLRGTMSLDGRTPHPMAPVVPLDN